ncbi:flagellar basal body-associated FliL family protein [Candidatus Haliotispira prima]|uniref:Flagellar protein FliL n=1 Tax=Candidatus Haliotispira prima TaxID=3034016 RepID=A0ABY8MG51_9SPIO|nr:flagellar basal body-associated FliL family protein [Candidatus Haliotispira prima]
MARDAFGQRALWILVRDTMADDIIEEVAEEDDSGSGKKRKGGGSIIVKVLVYVLVALIFLIVMVVVAYVTNRILDSGDRNTQLTKISNDFIVSNPIYTYYDQIPDLRARTADASPRSVTVKIELGYDGETFVNLSEELTRRKPQLTDFFRKYFSSHTARELSSTNENRVKEELKMMINELLQNGKIEEVVFTDFQVLDF